MGKTFIWGTTPGDNAAVAQLTLDVLRGGLPLAARGREIVACHPCCGGVNGRPLFLVKSKFHFASSNLVVD
ncbi:hypothetical protein [Telmatospirillum sp.]|uniref:hypothetical protein n=1 Tax=Telmatospirillum sp. TaxID=2079197 RepID=UPI00283FE1CA|nr:hypothetical protein [Telmatospirillum sp.]MDR3440015.1 hypothetical protein [Telmatospirillum sp.]